MEEKHSAIDFKGPGVVPEARPPDNDAVTLSII